MARMPSTAPVSASDPLAGPWKDAAAENRRLQAKNDPLATVRPDPNRTEVFRRGPDGKLHPIDGWHTTGPFDGGVWARNIDWPGVGWDLGRIAAGAWSGMGAIKSAGDVAATLWSYGDALRSDLAEADKRAKAKP
jgi:hypothetical protein